MKKNETCISTNKRTRKAILSDIFIMQVQLRRHSRPADGANQVNNKRQRMASRNNSSSSSSVRGKEIRNNRSSLPAMGILMQLPYVVGPCLARLHLRARMGRCRCIYRSMHLCVPMTNTNIKAKQLFWWCQRLRSLISVVLAAFHHQKFWLLMRQTGRTRETDDNEEKVNDIPVRVDNAYYFVDNVSKNYFLRTRVLFSSG